MQYGPDDYIFAAVRRAARLGRSVRAEGRAATHVSAGYLSCSPAQNPRPRPILDPCPSRRRLQLNIYIDIIQVRPVVRPAIRCRYERHRSPVCIRLRRVRPHDTAPFPHHHIRRSFCFFSDCLATPATECAWASAGAREARSSDALAVLPTLRSGCRRSSATFPRGACTRPCKRVTARTTARMCGTLCARVTCDTCLCLSVDGDASQLGLSR